MAIQKKIPVYRAIEMAMNNMAMEDRVRYIPLFKVWAKEAEEKIGSFTQYRKKIFVAEVDCCRAKLEECVVAILGLMPGDHGTECGLQFQNIYNQFNNTRTMTVSPQSGFTVVDTGSNNENCRNLNYSIQGNSLVFENNYDGKKVTYEALVYEVDCDGFIMINENHIDAIAQYIEMRWMKRQKHRKGALGYTQSEIADVDSEWHRKCALARGDDGEPSLSDRQEIIRMYNDPLSGLTNAQWLVTNPYYFYY